MSEASGNKKCLCEKKDCYYLRSLNNKSDKFCAYCFLTGQLRGCPVEDCIRYMSVTEKQRKRVMELEKLKWKDYNPGHVKMYIEKIDEVRNGIEKSTGKTL